MSLRFVLLSDEMLGIVMGIVIIGAVVERFHQFGRRIAQVQRHWGVAGLLHIGQSGVNGVVGRVGFGRCGEIDGGFGQRDAPFRPADLVYRIKRGVGQQQGVGIGQTDVLGRADHETARDELGVFAAGNHACQPIDGGIGITAADAFDEGRNNVVVHLPFLVIGHGILLQTLSDAGIVDDDAPLGRGIREQIDDIQQFTCIAARKTQQGIGFAHLKFAFAQHKIVLDRVV